MRYILIFAITFILCLFILFYNPYLGVYKDTITISLDDELESYSWNYRNDNDCIILSSSSENEWIFKPNKDGISNLYFTYTDQDNVKYEIYYKLKVKNNKIDWLEGYGKGLLSYPNPK